MNVKILAQNIVDNPKDFTAEEIEKSFEDYAKLRIFDVSESIFDKAVNHVQETYCDAHLGIPYMLLGDVAELIKITTGKEIDWNVLAKYSIILDTEGIEQMKNHKNQTKHIDVAIKDTKLRLNQVEQEIMLMIRKKDTLKEQLDYLETIRDSKDYE